MGKSLRILVVACAILGMITISSLLSARPAQAATLDMCQHGTALASLRMCVRHCDTMGYITNHTLTETLLFLIEDAQSAVDRGWNGEALADLQVVSMLLQAESGRHILVIHATDMLQQTQGIMHALVNGALLSDGNRDHIHEYVNGETVKH